MYAMSFVFIYVMNVYISVSVLFLHSVCAKTINLSRSLNIMIIRKDARYFELYSLIPII